MSTPSEILAKSRMVSRPSSKEFIESIFTDFFELHGDRHFEDDLAMVGGIALLEGMPVTVVGIQKGHTVKDNVAGKIPQTCYSVYKYIGCISWKRCGRKRTGRGYSQMSVLVGWT